MKRLSARVLFGIALALPVLGRALPVVITIDYSDLSHVKFTATGNFSNIDYSGGLKFNDGIALLGFFTSNVSVTDFGSYVSGNLSDSTNSGSAYFQSFSSWNDAHPSFYHPPSAPGGGDIGVDITLWTDNTGGPSGLGNTTYADTSMNFLSTSAAFTGEAVWDFSGLSSYTNLFPALNATGTVGVWNGNGTLGTWQVIGVPSAIPEPSTYTLLAGLGAMGVVVPRRRRRLA